MQSKQTSPLPSTFLKFKTMSSDEFNIIEKLIEIAKKKTESAFQKDGLYCSFKSRKKIHHLKSIEYLIKNIVKRHFHTECIYWCDRYLKSSDNHGKKLKRNILSTMILNFTFIGNHDMVLKVGREALTLSNVLEVKLATVQSDLFDIFRSR